MMDYLKERFRDYRTLTLEHAQQPKKQTGDLVRIGRKKGKTQTEKVVNFEIRITEVDFLINTFSVPASQLVNDFVQTVKRHASEALDVHISNMRVMSMNRVSLFCEITYTGDPTQYVMHEIREIKEEPFKGPLQRKNVDYNRLDDDDYNPYTDGMWSDASWHCVCCGSLLAPIAPHDEWWGSWAWDYMRRDKTRWYLCTNSKCTHSDHPLVLHHPTKGTNKPADESYSLSWIK